MAADMSTGVSGITGARSLLIRARYTEALPVVYGSNTFAFSDANTLIYWTDVVRDQLDMVTSVFLTGLAAPRAAVTELDVRMQIYPVYPPCSEPVWKRCCQRLEFMSGLRELWIELRLIYPAKRPDPKAELLDPLRTIRVAGDFVLEIHCGRDDSELVPRPVPRGPFRVIWTAEEFPLSLPRPGNRIAETGWGAR